MSNTQHSIDDLALVGAVLKSFDRQGCAETVGWATRHIEALEAAADQSGASEAVRGKMGEPSVSPGHALDGIKAWVAQKKASNQ